MPLGSELENLTSAFYDEGTTFDAGCDEIGVERYVEKCRELMPTKQACVIKNW